MNLASIAIDPYWPKWDSPWWHLLLRFELGEEIPRDAAEAMSAGVDRLRHTFPITPEECAGVNLQRDIACHCALGCMAQVLAAAGLPELPWIEPWFVRYQMADGGLNCDEEAYRVVGECPSSMVATVPALEAMLLGDPAGWSAARRTFIDRAARFLIERGLVRGSATVHNAEERDAAPSWHQLTFPRFYFYDVLRGLAALTRWAELTGATLPANVIDPVVAELEAKGPLRVERNAHAGKTTILPTADHSPSPRAPASTFRLLEEVRQIGSPAPVLERQWAQTRARLAALG
jgi:hypothetical protein